MAKQKVTAERYNRLKPVLDLLPDSRSGVGIVYETLNISHSTASRIKRTANFKEYLIEVRRGKIKKAVPPVPAQTNLIGDAEAILSKLEQIDKKLDTVIKLGSNPRYGSATWFGKKVKSERR